MEVKSLEPNRRGWIGRSMHYVLGPLFYWGGLYEDGSRTPSLTKLTTAVGFWLACVVMMGYAGYTITGQGNPFVLLSLVTLIVFASHGLRGLRMWAATKGGGTSEALPAAAAAEPARLEAVAKEIAARRASTGGDYEPS